MIKGLVCEMCTTYLGNEKGMQLIRSQIKDVKMSSKLCKQENDQMLNDTWEIEERKESSRS